MASTLLLDTETWDLVVGADGNIAVAAEPYALAQDAASSIKLFEAELWYDKSQGIPYFGQVLGKYPPKTLMKALFTRAALTVPNVRAARCFIRSIEGRTVTGQVQVRDQAGFVTAADF